MGSIKVSGLVVVGLWLVTAVFGYLGLGLFFAETVEGISGAAIPLWPRILFGLAAVVAIAATVIWAKRLKTRDDSGGEVAASGRRRFITGGAALTGGIVGAAGGAYAPVAPWLNKTFPAIGGAAETTADNPKDLWKGATIQSYRTLGRTGLKVSDISAGTTRLHNNADPVGFLNAMLDRGVNYLDASPDYAPQSEQIIRDAIAGRDRSKLVIATKFCHADGHVRQGSSVETYMQSMESAVQRLGTDYVDVAHVHSCDTVERLMDPNMHEAFDRLKEKGVVRHLGVSTHTPNLEEVADTAIDSGRFDVMMLAYHHGAWPNLVSIIDRAAAEGVGIVAMKTLKGARHAKLADFSTEADSYTQAAFKWVMSNPNVANLVISFFNDQHLDEYLYASGQALTTNDIAVLEKYDQLIAGTHCFQHCGTCLPACPESIPIHDVLRHRMYFEDYGDQKQAMQLYAKLEKNASACVTCAAPCATACPEGLPIRERLIGAHEMLT